jgi:hypothetical protein
MKTHLLRQDNPNCPFGHKQTNGIFGSFNWKHFPWLHGFFEHGEIIFSKNQQEIFN